MRRLLLLVLVALGTPACDQGSSVSPPLQDGQLDPVENPHGGGVTPLPDPDEQSGRVGRSARRLTVAQLGTSIETAVGLPWKDLDARAASLGRADYALINAESTEPNLVFAKFLEEGARTVCLQRARDEKAMLEAKSRTLGRTLPDGKITDLTKLEATQVREMLVYLSTRFWGAPLRGEELTQWEGFFTKAAARSKTTNKPEEAIAVVCIALMTDSRFLTY
ncbi:hypothetical protein [Melittangium boletus]|uniref:Uncharacterized protein n=1 Tax=Melittangium boletus DSM 14713 TaxID=1294270 RepID=A0A250IIC5_9BACT|nr:hypothetical protein [Melittangium boletus]ATB30983.1 hypothetical protein MEBOL_004445 [Melittangium boletus DSM 14713]